MFHHLANLPIDHSSIAKAMTKRGRKFAPPPQDTHDPQTMEGAQPALEAEPGTLKVSLAATPRRSFVVLCWLGKSNKNNIVCLDVVGNTFDSVLS